MSHAKYPTGNPEGRQPSPLLKGFLKLCQSACIDHSRTFCCSCCALQVMQEQQTLAWHSFCQSISASVTAATQAAARQLQQLTPELQSALAAQDASGLQHRLPHLAGRMQEVLGGSTDGQSPGTWPLLHTSEQPCMTHSDIPAARARVASQLSLASGGWAPCHRHSTHGHSSCRRCSAGACKSTSSKAAVGHTTFLAQPRCPCRCPPDCANEISRKIPTRCVLCT